MRKRNKIIIAGGGTAGHVYSGISIANSITNLSPSSIVHFIGSNRLESKKVPEAGYVIDQLVIKPFNRRNYFKNILLLYYIVISTLKAMFIIIRFNPGVVLGIGNYISFPTLLASLILGKPILIYEQNSSMGLVNRLFTPFAKKVFLGYELKKKRSNFYLTGNSVRIDILKVRTLDKAEIYKHLKLDPSKKTLLVLGGSLGARAINEEIKEGFSRIIDKDCQIVWSTGEKYFKTIQSLFEDQIGKKVFIYPHIKNIHYFYRAATVVIARAGALTISELSLLGKPSIFIPSPNVTDDHQTVNTKILESNNAAIIMPESKIHTLIDTAIELLNNTSKQEALSMAIKKLARPNASKDIASKLIEVCNT